MNTFTIKQGLCQNWKAPRNKEQTIQTEEKGIFP